MRISILTLFPEMFPGVLGHSLPGKALVAGLWHLEAVQIRDFAFDKHKTVDDTPYGGGAGMVMKPDVLYAALQSLPKDARKIYLSPRGELFTQKKAQELSRESHLAFLCGRYEGIDQRVIDHHALEEISLGDFVLAGGEVAAMAMIEAIVRLLPGVLGNADTMLEESFSDGLLEYPHYTKPPVWEGYAVPDILLSGDHAKIKAWRQAEAERLTRARRPDLVGARGPWRLGDSATGGRITCPPVA
jgi:tRNA (guanine37-N1)-methyltransferase